VNRRPSAHKNIRHQPYPPRNHPGAFTLVELLVVITIIAAVVAIVLPMLGSSLRVARVSAEQQTVRSLAFGCVSFRDDMGFDVPVIDESANPIGTVNNIPALRVLTPAQLAAQNTPTDWAGNNRKHSTLSLPAFLLGAVDETIDNRVLDGRAGPAMGRVSLVDSGNSRFATFDLGGRSFGPYYDLGRQNSRLLRDTNNPGRTAIFTHAWADLGRAPTTTSVGWPNNTSDMRLGGIRYYAWDTTAAGAAFSPASSPALDLTIAARTVPPELLNPSVRQQIGGAPNRLAEDPEFRSARWAVVSPGPDGLFGDEAEGLTPEEAAKAREDNIVEIGR